MSPRQAFWVREVIGIKRDTINAKGVILQDGTILHVRAPNNRASKYMRQKWQDYKEKDRNLLL